MRQKKSRKIVLIARHITNHTTQLAPFVANLIQAISGWHSNIVTISACNIWDNNNQLCIDYLTSFTLQNAVCFSVLPMDDYLATTSLSLVWMLAGSDQRHELADALFELEKKPNKTPCSYCDKCQLHLKSSYLRSCKLSCHRLHLCIYQLTVFHHS